MYLICMNYGVISLTHLSIKFHNLDISSIYEKEDTHF